MAFGFFRSVSQSDQGDPESEPTVNEGKGKSTQVELVPRICQVPPEILQHIFSYLECQHLVSLRRTCKILKQQAEQEYLWIELLRQQLPSSDFPAEPFPSSSYRHLYLTHHPRWFLPRYRLWYSDDPYAGKIILVKYDKNRGCIEGYRIAAERGPVESRLWSYKPSVEIHSFDPRVYISKDDPVLSLSHEITEPRENWRDTECRMKVGSPGSRINASFFLSRNIPERFISASTEIWPPLTIPTMPRARDYSGDKFRSKGHKPQKYEEISQTTFRLRTWTHFMQGIAALGVKISEEVSTWSTLDPALYTPTKEKPYQGIFVGDYAAHGCEFLLVIQTEQAPAPPPRDENSVGYILTETLQAMQHGIIGQEDAAQTLSNGTSVPLEDDSVHHGALEGIKLTGDINVPRGEHSFIADDIGRAGLIRIAEEEPFKGARVVKSRGHVAARGFQNDDFIPSQLILVSPDLLAQYWIPFGHISYYKRVDFN